MPIFLFFRKPRLLTFPCGLEKGIRLIPKELIRMARREISMPLELFKALQVHSKRVNNGNGSFNDVLNDLILDGANRLINNPGLPSLDARARMAFPKSPDSWEKFAIKATDDVENRLKSLDAILPDQTRPRKMRECLLQSMVILDILNVEGGELSLTNH